MVLGKWDKYKEIKTTENCDKEKNEMPVLLEYFRAMKAELGRDSLGYYDNFLMKLAPDIIDLSTLDWV